MDLSIIGRRQNREITGPTPHSVAIRAKPTLKKPIEHLILKRREQDDLRAEAIKMVDYTKKFDLKTTWERMTDRRIQLNTIKNRAENMLQQYSHSLEERRDRLRELLEQEEERYITEMTSNKETTLERQAKMRERAKYLKDKRETERQALAEQKLEQRWREECEEMRSLLVKRNADNVFTERAEQLRVKWEEQERQREIESMYARMWDEDRLTKCNREEIETAMQIERNKEALKVLTLQSAAIEKRREEMVQLREKEAELLREEAALRALEQERGKEDKRVSQDRRRAELDLSLRMKMKRKAREMQEELAMDMKLLQEVLQKTTNEDLERNQRKNELREEIKLYLQYLSDQREVEKLREKELDEMVNSEVERQMKQRLAQWRKEKEARKRLLDDVMATRRRQIQEKMENIAVEKQEWEREGEEMANNVAKHQLLVEEEKKNHIKKNISYQVDLQRQIDYRESLKEREKEDIYREEIMAAEAEKIHQQRVQHALMNPDLKKTHPQRLFFMTNDN